MSQGLFRVTYLSTAVEPFGALDLQTLLFRTRTRNAAKGVTGLLVYHDGCFIQVLEGPRDVVEDTLATIRTDPRHIGVIVLEQVAIAERSFPHFSMSYVPSGQMTAEQCDGFVSLVRLAQGRDASPLTRTPPVTGYIRSFLGSFREFEAA
ncbi:MAG: BLUF domain-containing protein [Hyphomonadaceae bacterium]